MAFDITKLTNAINRHLNAISDISARARQASEEAAQRAQFAIDLKDAINRNMQSHMNLDEAFPDIGSQIQAAVQETTGAVSAAASQAAFNTKEGKSASAATRTDNASSLASELISSVSGSSNSAGSGTGENTGSSGTLTGTPKVASKSMSLEDLQDLSKSQYFATNLIQDSLYKTDDDEGSSSITSSTLLTPGNDYASILLQAYNQLQNSSAATGSFQDIHL